MRSSLKHWRESASVIALARSDIIKNAEKSTNGYEILFQKRSPKSVFLPSTIVFPGGAIDESDSGKSWINHFKSFGITEDIFKDFEIPDASNSLIFQHESDPKLKNLALRITAIRETFEELGVLICKGKQNPINNNNSATFFTDFDIQHWQKKVHQDPLNFLSLCQSLDCYPDIWALHLWSNWLTPIKVTSHRFNSVFFLTFFDEKPLVTIDKKEVAEFWWSTPDKVLESFREKKLLLPTPQWYELSRFERHTDIDQLQKFAISRSKYGCELFFPYYQVAKDGVLVILPGDDLYPKTPNLFEKTQLIDDNKTLQELRDSSSVMHRIIYQDSHTLSYDIKNYIPKFGHISPATECVLSTIS